VSAADILFTPSVQRVLAATLAHPERAYTLKELLAVAASGRGNTQQQIERLLSAGVLVEAPRRGRHRSIKANVEYLLYPELCSILRKTFGVADPLRKTLQPFAGQIEEAFVFGSVAKGTDTQRSDIDLVVVGTAELLALSEALYATEQALGRTIHLSSYEPGEWRELLANDPVVRQIAQGPKLALLPDGRGLIKAAQPTGTISGFVGLLAGRSKKVATLEEINTAAAQGQSARLL